MKNWDRYLDPPDELEKVLCEFCGKEVEYHELIYKGGISDKWTTCTNPFCPSKHDGISKEMAIRILELEYDFMKLKRKVYGLEHK